MNEPSAVPEVKPPELPPRRTRLYLRIARISWRDLAVTLGPVLLISAGAIALAVHYVRPAPPREVVMAAGTPGSSLHTYAEKYRDNLAEHGVTLKLEDTEGSLDNLKRLADLESDVDVAFVSGGLAGDTDLSNLASLGSVFYQPLVVFYRAARDAQRLSEFKGQRIAVGAEGTGTRVLALALLKANGIEPGGATRLEPLSGDEAVAALTKGAVNAVFLSGDSASVASIRKLLHTPGVRMFDFVQGEAYARRFRYLKKIDLPPGAFDLGENLPARPITMLAPTVELVARWDLHPAISDLLIEAAKQVNGSATMLQEQGEFPAPREHEYTISEDARRYYTSGKTFAYKHLPFWLASLVDRAAVVLVPLIVVLIPGLRIVPTLYAWRLRARVYRRYGELMALERSALLPMSAEERAALVARLDEIEKAVIALRMPGAFADQLYVLRQHITFVRNQLGRGVTPAATVPAK